MSLVLYDLQRGTVARYLDKWEEPAEGFVCLVFVATPAPECGPFEKLRCVDLPDLGGLRLVRTWEVLEQSPEEQAQTRRILEQQP